MSNNGTGQPNWFRCAKCRSTLRGDRNAGWASDVELTGRQKPFVGKGGARVTHILREYRCKSCGHVGWSRHIDLADKAGEHHFLQLVNGEHHLPSYAKPDSEVSA